MSLNLNHSQVLTVIIPVYNEKEFVEQSVRNVCEVSLPTVSKREVIVVDDGSTDGTRTILKRLQGELQFVLVEHERNLGKGMALQTGIKKASGDFIVFHDADLEYDPQDLNKMLVPLQSGKADAVYGSRFVGSEMRRLLFYWHEKGNKFITMLVNMMTNLNFTDVETCYKMFKSDFLKWIQIESNDFAIEIELTIKAAQKKLRFYEVPISYNGRTYAQGKKITWRDGFKALYSILKFSLQKYE